MIDQDTIHAFREGAAKFIAAEVEPRTQELDQPNGIPDDLYCKLAKNGYLGCTIPEEYGGLGLSLVEYCVILEEMAKGHSSMMLAVTMTSGPIPKSILNGAGDAVRKELLPKICDGSIKIAFGLSEPEAGSDAASMRTTATKVDGGWTLEGVKQWITWGHEADYVQVMAITDKEKGARGGVTAFLVSRNAKGFTVASTDVSIGNDVLAELHFSDVFVADEHVIGGVGNGFAVAMSSLDEGRLGVAAGCIGAAARALELATEHAKQRVTFGKPLAQRQAIQWMLADSAVELEAARSLLQRALEGEARGEQITTLASIAKLYASEMVGRVCDRAMQIHGAAGMVRSLGVERLYRETRHFRVGEGTSEIQRTIIARSLLAE